MDKTIGTKEKKEITTKDKLLFALYIIIIIAVALYCLNQILEYGIKKMMIDRIQDCLNEPIVDKVNISLLYPNS